MKYFKRKYDEYKTRWEEIKDQFEQAYKHQTEEMLEELWDEQQKKIKIGYFRYDSEPKQKKRKKRKRNDNN